MHGDMQKNVAYIIDHYSFIPFFYQTSVTTMSLATVAMFITWLVTV